MKTWVRHFFFAHKLRTIILLLIVVAIGYFGSRQLINKPQATPYQTVQVEKGTLVNSVSASGTISAGNSVSIATQATGVVTAVYVKNGDHVSQGQRIADITLDQSSQQKLAAANATYQSAVSSKLQAEQAKIASDAQLWQDRQTVLSAQNTEDLKNQGVTSPSTKVAYTNLEMQVIDSALIEANKTFDADQQKIFNADQVITSAKAQVTAAALSLAQISSTITAPMSGDVSNLTLLPGLAIMSNSSTSTTATASSAQNLGTITLPNSQTQAMVNLSEIDVIQIAPDQKVTLTLDAFPDKTFAGVVKAINTTGTISSGVTTYPATIAFDTTDPLIYPNMVVTAKIITRVKDDILLVPSAAVQTSNGQSTVRVLRNGQPATVTVQIGASNDTQTEITNGLAQSDNVITGGGPAATTTTQSSGATSPFSVLGGGNRGFGGGGGAVRGGTGR